jgi:hypothetical protein
MPGPPWLRVALAMLMAVIAVGSVVRIVLTRSRGRKPELESDGLHALMGVAMAGMLLPWLAVLPVVAWQVAFGCAAAWFGWRGLGARRGPGRRLAREEQPGRQRGRRRPGPASMADQPHGAPLAHLVECLAMIFMMHPGAGSAFSGMSQVVALLLALCLVGCLIWVADKVVLARDVAVADGTLTLRLTAGGRIIMGIAMLYMLIQMA